MKRFSKLQLYLIAMSILLPNTEFGATTPRSAFRAPHSSQTDTGALIDGLQAKYSRMQGLAADFIQVYHASDGRTKRESGTLLLKRPGKARWNYFSPEQKVFVSDGKNIFFYVSGEKYATRSAIKQSVDPQIPFLFLLGRTNIRRAFSSIEAMPDERAVESGNVVLRLVPKRAPEDFKRILAEVSPQRFSVTRLVIIERSGARMDFHLKNVRENHTASDSEFLFTPPAGVSIRQAR
ncbi:MAG: outer membrane lipoprotein chaperone LolA [Acidobacteriota bacterium]